MTAPTPDPTTDDPDAAPDVTQEPDGEPTPNNEAARYRVRLREVETERDTIAERLNGYQRRECEAVVADLLAQPDDLWEIGAADLAAFFGDDGAVNADELRAAAAALIKQRPGLAASDQALASVTPHTRAWGQYSPPGGAAHGGPSWADVINGR